MAKFGNTDPNCNAGAAKKGKAEMLSIDSRDRNSSSASPPKLSYTELSDLPDEPLVASMLSGQDEALGVIYDRYFRLVFAVCWKIVRNKEEAEDIMQNVFLEFYKSAAKYDRTRGPVKVWLLQIAYHRSLTKRQHLHAKMFAESTLENVIADESRLQNSGTRAAHCLTNDESSHLVDQALKSLDDAQRETICLAFFEGLSLKEIARITNQSFGNVRHHYYRGLKKLRSLIVPKNTSQSQKLVLEGTLDAKP
ncbi:MAG TPA: sigma-70 family RNA polymerase sigma factor [Terriglobales bacterium]|nr:sigma-70 family RNA polymerase sigma factor [Terriglobales bacterium]